MKIRKIVHLSFLTLILGVVSVSLSGLEAGAYKEGNKLREQSHKHHDGNPDDDKHHDGEHHEGEHHDGKHHGKKHHGEKHHGEKHHGKKHHGEKHHGEKHHGKKHHGDQHHGDQHHGGVGHSPAPQGDLASDDRDKDVDNVIIPAA